METCGLRFFMLFSLENCTQCKLNFVISDEVQLAYFLNFNHSYSNSYKPSPICTTILAHEGRVVYRIWRLLSHVGPQIFSSRGAEYRSLDSKTSLKTLPMCFSIISTVFNAKHDIIQNTLCRGHRYRSSPKDSPAKMGVVCFLDSVPSLKWLTS